MEEPINECRMVALAMEAAAYSEDRCQLSADVCRLGSSILMDALDAIEDHPQTASK